MFSQIQRQSSDVASIRSLLFFNFRRVSTRSSLSANCSWKMKAFASTSADTFAAVSRLSDAACDSSFFGMTMPNSFDKRSQAPGCPIQSFATLSR